MKTRSNEHSSRLTTHGKQRRLKLLLVILALLAAGSQGCSVLHGKTGSPSYRPDVRGPRAAKVVDCRLDEGETKCVILPFEDFDRMWIELKAACLALGNERSDCGIDPDAVE